MEAFFSHTLFHLFQDKGQHKAQLENATQTLEEIKGNFAKLAGAGQLHLVVDNQTLPVVEGSFSANRTVPLCQTGSMLLDTEECSEYMTRRRRDTDNDDDLDIQSPL